MSVASMLNLTCRVRTKSVAQSTTTGAPGSPTYTNKTGVPCAIQALSASESVAQGAERGVRAYEVFFAHALAVTVGDIIDTIAGDAVWAGRTLSLSSPPVDDSGRGVYYACTATEVGGGAQR